MQFQELSFFFFLITLMELKLSVHRVKTPSLRAYSVQLKHYNAWNKIHLLYQPDYVTARVGNITEEINFPLAYD
jgi:hypothetical protein